jgi:hypothetical protein
VNESMNVWPDTEARMPGHASDDVLDDLAETVLAHRGSVTVLPGHRMPESHAASAILKRRAPTSSSRPRPEELPYPWSAVPAS